MAGDSKRQGCQVSRKGLFSNQPALTVVLNKFADGASARPPPPRPRPRATPASSPDTTGRAAPWQEGAQSAAVPRWCWGRIQLTLLPLVRAPSWGPAVIQGGGGAGAGAAAQRAGGGKKRPPARPVLSLCSSY